MSLFRKNAVEMNSNPKSVPILNEATEMNEPHIETANLTEGLELLERTLSTENSGGKEPEVLAAQVNVPLAEPHSALEEIAAEQLPDQLQHDVEEAIAEQVKEQPLIIYEKVYVPLHLQASIEALFKWNDVLIYRTFFETIVDFYAHLDFEIKKQWEYSITQARLQMRQQVEYIEEFVNRGVQKMKDTEALMKAIFLENLSNLKPLEKFAESDLVTSPDFSLLLEGIRAEIKNGTKVSYKLIQQLQMQLEELQHKEIETVQVQSSAETAGALISQQQLIDLTQEIETLKQHQKQSIQTMIKAIDMLDLIKNSAIQSNIDGGWVEQIEQAIQSYLSELKKMDIQEIEALGKMLDGAYMISIGNVPQEAAPNYERFEVCIVHERGFIQTSTGKIIREAKVLSVY